MNDVVLHGIYQHAEDGLYGLFINGEWQVVSAERQDCIDEAKVMGYDFE
jgi:hypothetical protein